MKQYIPHKIVQYVHERDSKHRTFHYNMGMLNSNESIVNVPNTNECECESLFPFLLENHNNLLYTPEIVHATDIRNNQMLNASNHVSHHDLEESKHEINRRVFRIGRYEYYFRKYSLRL